MAQNLMTCQFCEISNETKWKCINCDLILCQECKIKLHTKLKKNENHKVIDLKEFSNLGASETIRDLDLKDIQCTIHNTEHCIIYCQDCEVLSCAVCLLESHQNHKLAKIDEVYSQKVKELQELDNKISQNLPYFEKCGNDLQAIKSDEHAQYYEIKQNISKQETELKERITKQKENLIKELDKLWTPREREISTQLQNIKIKSDDLSDKKRKIQEAFQSHNASTIFNTSVKVGTDLPDIPDNLLSKQQIILSQTKDEKSGLDSLETIPMLKVTGTFTSDMPEIYKVKNLVNDINIMCLADSDIIHTFVIKDNKFKTTNIAEKIGGNVIDMTVTNKDKLLFTTLENSEINILSTFTPGSELEAYISISPFHARGIHATCKNIFIGFINAEDLFPLTSASKRGIKIYDYNCQHVRTIERDQNNQLLFSLPEAITTNINGDICVVDSTNISWEGRVVVLGEWGNFKWAYDGHPSINTECNFTPYDLVTTSKGLILVTDRDSNAVHILSMDGVLVSSLNKSQGIEKPLGLNIDHKGQLQIGCDSEGTNNKLAKLHLVGMSF
ncbi:unnamed protein product [Mytilus coruscus]|uniref:B box-type domain-containing protein n=1 Tax=Mytilus coruscus TaxID=42192 RepID=A0A6J8AEF4_MYTCO|nr:unnamed protein product [Mytilus coruscus]